MKNWQLIFVSVLISVLSLCSAGILNEYGLGKSMWDKAGMVLSFLGVVITIGAAVPVISALLSYQNFTKESERAEGKLKELSKKQAKVENDANELLDRLISKEKQIENILKKHADQESKFNLLYRYVFNEKMNDDEHTLVSSVIDIRNVDMGYRLYSILAKFKQEDDEIRINEAIFGNEKFNEEIIELGIKAIPYYAMLAKLEPNAEQSYRDHIRYIIKHFIESKNLSNEMIERVRQVVLDVVREDEFYLFDFGMDNDLIEIIVKINEIFKISYQDLQSYELINPYNYRGKRISNIFKS